MHTCDTRLWHTACEMRACEMHAYEIHIRHSYKMQACDIQAYKMQAFEMHAREGDTPLLGNLTVKHLRGNILGPRLLK